MTRWTPERIKELGRLQKDLIKAQGLISKSWALLEGIEMTAEDFESDGYAPIADTHALSDCRDSLTFIEEQLKRAIKTVDNRLRKSTPNR